MPESILDHVKLRLVENIDDLHDFKRWVGERREGPLGVDTESEGLNPHKHKLRLVQFGDLHQGWAIPWELWRGGIVEIIRDYDREWVCHNLPFEQRLFQIYGGIQLPWERCHDTMVRGKILNPMADNRLKQMSTRIVDPTAAQGQEALEKGMEAQKWTWATVPLDFAPYWVYGALDPVLTAHCEAKLRPEVDASAPRAYDLEMATLRICTNMMLKGMKLDVPYVEASIKKLRKFSEDARQWLKDTYGITSPNSAGQITRALESFGVEIMFFTASGAPGTDKESLEIYGNYSPDPRVKNMVKYILAIRHAEKMLGSYLEKFLHLKTSDDLIHASINTMAARTCRMSISDPSLQNLHRDDKVIRGSYVPREGNVYISADLDQVEARMAAHFTEDEGLIQAFLRAGETGGDYFCEVAKTIYGEDIDKKDPRRNMVKTIVYRSNYGGGDNIDAMAATAKVSYEQMAKAKDSFSASFPGIQVALDRIAAEAKQHRTPFILSPLGRKLTMQRGKEYTQGFNALIQGHAAEYFKQCLIDIDASGLGDRLVLPIHDEALLEVPKDEAEEALRTVEMCMSNLTDYRVPITAGGGIMEERWQKG